MGAQQQQASNVAGYPPPAVADEGVSYDVEAPVGEKGGPAQAPPAYPPPAYPQPAGPPGGYAPKYYQQGPAAPVVVVTHTSQSSGCSTQLILFIAGWFFTIPWWIGAIMHCCNKRKDPRDKWAGIANIVLSAISLILIVILIILVATGVMEGSACVGYNCDYYQGR